MNRKGDTPSDLSTGVARSALVIGAGVALAIAGLLVLQALAAPRIASVEAARRAERLARLLPADAALADAEDHAAADSVLSGCSGALEAVHVLTDRAGKSYRILEIMAPDGYSGPIELLVRIDRADRVGRMDVLRHRETPGLGDRIEPARSDWLQALDGLGPDSPAADWTLSRDGGDIDALSGATITARAVLEGTRSGLREYARLAPARATRLDPSSAHDCPQEASHGRG